MPAKLSQYWLILFLVRLHPHLRPRRDRHVPREACHSYSAAAHLVPTLACRLVGVFGGGAGACAWRFMMR